MTKTQDLVFLPLGGVGEIGMNLALYGFGSPEKRDWIMVDCGVTFPGPELPGVDLVLPDIDFVKRLGKRLKAIIITHAHEDHYGGLAQLWPQLKVPVHASAFTAGMLEAKRAYERTRAEVPINLFKAGERFTVGPFEIEPIAVNHSIPEPFSLAIRTPLGNLIHTGDWKIDLTPSLGPLTDENRFRQLGKEGILAMMCDSTNAMRDGISPSEKEISQGLREVIEQAEGRVAITTFSSNVGRIRSIAEAARDAGREVLLLGSSIKRVVNVATDLGMMEGIPEFLAEDEYGYIPRDKVVVILTGSQGEPRAALAKLSRDEMRNVALASGDTVVFSSRTIPGNEKGIIEIKNGLIDQGIKIITDTDALVHVSGHPRRSELVQMYEWVKPKILVPVHGEAAHLTAQAALAQASGASRSRHGCAMDRSCGWRRAIRKLSAKCITAASTRTAICLAISTKWEFPNAASCRLRGMSRSMSCWITALNFNAIRWYRLSVCRRLTATATTWRTFSMIRCLERSKASRADVARIPTECARQFAALFAPPQTRYGARNPS